ncbi:MAG: hypothetical protein UW28_C0003G0030 [Parcubacteria group bacterium GW2011_GWA2_44_13]|nr:MAG: hypothetical protein UW28_C0003G0030 [Parcubacteria group bacterium GW2011_GWA2_44_13]
MLNPDSGASKAENKPPEPKASEPESKNQYDAVFSARREAEEESKPAGKMPEPESSAPKEAEPKITSQVSPEDRMAQIDARTQEIAKEIRLLDKSSADFRQKSEEYEFLRKEYNDLYPKTEDDLKFMDNAKNPYNYMSMSPEEKTKLYKIQTEVARGKESKGKTIASPEAIENFVPAEDRVRSLKENMVVGARNKDTEDFLKMIAEPYERVGKMKEDKSGKTFLEKAKEVVSRGKEWITKPSLLRERLLGIATAGIWDIHQADKFRRGKKKTGKELAEVAKEIQSRRGLLTYPEAFELHNKLAAGEKLGESVTREKIDKIACEIKRERNLKYINAVLQYADHALQERLKGYSDAKGTQLQLDPERRRAMLGELGKKLVAMQDSPKSADAKEFSKIIKDNLNPKYWTRYAYGGLEAALWAVGIWWYTSGSESALVKGPVKYMAPSGSEGAPSKLTLNAGDNPWNALKEWLQQNGIPNPSDMQVQATDTIVSHSTGYGVTPWDIAGSPLDTQLPVGYELDVSEAARQLEWIKNLHK